MGIADDFADAELTGTTNIEKLDACLRKMKQNKLIASGQLSQSILRIKTFVQAVVNSNCEAGDGKFDKSPILYICGSPGTGKTMSTKQICEDVIAAKRLSLKKSDKPPRCSYLNCFTIQEKIEEVLEKIGT